MSALQGKKILLAVCGSIAAYKSVYLTRLLLKAGAEVQVIMSQSAKDFVGPLTFAALTKKECLSDFTNSSSTLWNNHVALALWADIMVIAPATSSTISKMASGLCDNLLIGVYMSARCPVMVAPAMDEDMWKHPSTRENIAKLQQYGNKILAVGEGELASGLNGPGRMAEPEEIFTAINRHFECLQFEKSSLKGKKILITAGPTYEHLDPVRFLGNHSTGKMGIAIADAAAARGAEVTLVMGPTSLKSVDERVSTHHVQSAKEMLSTAQPFFEDTDIVIFAAAVADYTPQDVAEEKIKKSDDTLTILLRKNVDIAAAFAEVKKKNQLSVGFALETNKEMEHASEKLIRKKFDLVVLNSLKDPGAGFKHETNKITILDKYQQVHRFELKSKKEVAEDILSVVESFEI
jgi:phosphopantothenoylcysteine decarboxylase/phosphopantothenate--cysteine ligase